MADNIIISPELDALLNDKVINEAFITAMSSRTGVLSTVSFGGQRPAENGSGLSWLDNRMDADGSALGVALTDIATTATVVDGNKFRAGMTISAKNSDEVILVVSVAGNVLTIERGFGGTTAEAVLIDVLVNVDSVGREENSTATNDAIYQPTTVLNYFQTMDTAIEFSRRALASLQVGNTNDVVFQLSQRMRQLTIQMDRALVKGRKVTTTSVGGKEITFTGGIKYFLDQTGAILEDNGAAALTLAAINSLNAEIVSRGGEADTIAVGIDKARIINDLVGNNYSSARLAEWQSDEGSVIYLPNDIPTVAGVNKIVLDTNLNDDELLLYDSKMINIIPMGANNGEDGNWTTKDATVNGQDGIRTRILGDFGMEIRQSQTHMARLKNIG